MARVVVTNQAKRDLRRIFSDLNERAGYRVAARYAADFKATSPSPLVGEGWGEGVSSQEAFLSCKSRKCFLRRGPLTRRASRVDLSHKGRGDDCSVFHHSAASQARAAGLLAQ
jgi:plasmid stabilization system protein ParE